MDFGKKISVVVPVYNVEKYLDNTITHILNQTYENLEIILVDDGSKDRSGQMCDAFAKKDDRIKVIHKENGGSSSARNRGMEAATGDYITFPDADDYCDETMFERLIRVCEEKQCVLAQVMSCDYDEQGNCIKEAYKSTGEVNFIPVEENFSLLMRHLGDSSFCTKLIRTDFAKKFRFSEHKLNEDFRLILEMMEELPGVWSIEEAHYHILIRNGSNQRSGFKKELYEAVIENADYALEECKTRFPNCKKETERFFYWQRLDYLLHIPVEMMTKENMCYQKVLKDIRSGKKIWQENEYLTEKEKKNLSRLSAAPILAKRVHRILMHLKGNA